MSGGPRVLYWVVRVRWEATAALLCKLWRDLAADRKLVDLTAPDQIRDLVRRVRPQVLLNAAAYTAVDERSQTLNLRLPSMRRPPACWQKKH